MPAKKCARNNKILNLPFGNHQGNNQFEQVINDR